MLLLYRCFFVTGTLNHAPLTLQGQRLWLSTQVTATDPSNGGPAWYTLPEWRLGGLYAPANAQFTTGSFILPESGLTINVDASWTDGLSAENASKCDPLRELCQSYVFAELLDAANASPPA